MKKILLSVICFTAIQFLSAQNVYKNGPVGTGTKAKDGTKAPKNFQWSEGQNDSDLTSANATYGFAGYFSSSAGVSYSLADDFIVPDGKTFHITSASVFAYQTDNNGENTPFKELRLRIWEGKPYSEGSTEVFGDITTNRLSSTTDSATYRIANTLFFSNAVDTRRRVWKLTGDVDVTLTAGTYWLEWQTVAKNDGANFCPAATVIDTRGLPEWNAVQQDKAKAPKVTGVVDLGTDGNGVPQDFPFEFTYEDVLPVTLFNFTGTINNNQAYLSWSTATENNNKGFYIERSKDGQHFSSMGFVSGAGNSSQVKNYAYTDITLKDLITSTAYYRLRQVDMDGNMSYSKILPLSLKDIIRWKLYPNPVKDRAIIEMSLTAAARVSLQIVSNDGKILINTDKGLVSEGYQVFSINTQNLAGGTYFIRLTAGDQVFKQLLIKQ